MQKMNQMLSRYRQDAAGSILMTLAPFIMVLTLLVGGFIDFGRGNINRAETLGAIDAAALAAAGMPAEFALSDADRENVAQRYYNFNVQSILGNRVEYPDLDVEISDTNGVVEVSVSASNSIETTFLKAGHVDQINTSGTTKVMGGGKISSVMDADIVIVGDVSQSMENCDYNNKSCDGDPTHQRGYQVSEKTNLLLEKIYPLDDHDKRVETSFVRSGLVTYSDEVKTYYGKTGAKAYPGASLRASYSEANDFLKKYISKPKNWEGYTCASCGVAQGIDLFEAAPPRPDGVKNSPVKLMVFLTDGQTNRPCPDGSDDCDSKDPAVLQFAATQFTDQCTKAKNDDVIIITIGYGPSFAGTNDGSSFNVHQSLQDCASIYVDEHGVKQKRYYVAKDSLELENIMSKVIPEQLNQLRIIK